MHETQSTDEDRSRKKMKHEIANDFAVISMGLHCLNGIRNEPEQFAEIVEMMSSNLQSLRTRIDSLLAQAEHHATAPSHSHNSTHEHVD